MFPWAPVVDKKIRKPDWHVDQPPEDWNFLREEPEVLIDQREYRLAQYMTGVTRDEAAYILCELTADELLMLRRDDAFCVQCIGFIYTNLILILMSLLRS
jgi:hypothetical protein